jgi:hypothetical protein
MAVSRTLACCVAVNIVLTAMPATSQVMNKSSSPAQASPQQGTPLPATPMQPTSPRPTMQAVPNLQLNCANFQRNTNGSWTQRTPVTVDGKTSGAAGSRLKPGTMAGGTDLGAALDRQCR